MVLMMTVLALLSFVEPLGTDIYLPAFPRMVTDLATTPAAVQLTLTTFLVGLAAGHLLFGSISDRYGRRTPLMVGTVVAAAAGAACALAPSVTWLAVLRAVQGVAAASGMVIARSIVSDTARGARATRLFGVLVALLGIAPIVAPLLGGAVIGLGGWRAVFWVLAGLTVLLAVAVAVAVPETLPVERRVTGGPGDTVRAARSVLTNRAFLGHTIAFSCTFGALFCYVSGSAFLYQDVFGLGVGGTAAALAGTVLVQSSAALFGSRLAGRIPPTRLVAIGLSAMLVGGIGLLVLALTGALVLPLALALLVPFSVGIGLVMPNATSMAFDALPNSAGTGSAIFGCLQHTAAAAAAPIVGLAGGEVTISLAAGMTAMTALGVAALPFASRAWSTRTTGT